MSERHRPDGPITARVKEQVALLGNGPSQVELLLAKTSVILAQELDDLADRFQHHGHGFVSGHGHGTPRDHGKVLEQVAERRILPLRRRQCECPINEFHARHCPEYVPAEEEAYRTQQLMASAESLPVETAKHKMWCRVSASYNTCTCGATDG